MNIEDVVKIAHQVHRALCEAEQIHSVVDMSMTPAEYQEKIGSAVRHQLWHPCGPTDRYDRDLRDAWNALRTDDEMFPEKFADLTPSAKARVYAFNAVVTGCMRVGVEDR